MGKLRLLIVACDNAPSTPDFRRNEGGSLRLGRTRYSTRRVRQQQGGPAGSHAIESAKTEDACASAGSQVHHTVRIAAPRAGAADLAAFFEQTDRITTVRNGMQQTLMNVRAAAEEA